MTYAFKIWNQANDNHTMAIRVRDTHELGVMASGYAEPSDDAHYASLQDYLTQIHAATAPIPAYRRTVDVLWNTPMGYGTRKYFSNRILESTYSGNVRPAGGFSAQCYVMVDPDGFGALGASHLVPISVEIIPGGVRDLLIVSA